CSASVALLAWMVQRNPQPALTARLSSNASAPRTSPTTMRSGRIASTNLELRHHSVRSLGTPGIDGHPDQGPAPERAICALRGSEGLYVLPREARCCSQRP